MQRILALFIALALATSSLATVPQTLSYSGTLSNTSGSPLSGSHNITFALYDAAEDGNMLWSETQDLNVVQGAFAAVLGSVNPLDLPFDQQYWLGVQVDNDPELPRTQLTASPYSLNAASAEKLGDAVTVDASDKVSIGTTLKVGPVAQAATANPGEVIAGGSNAAFIFGRRSLAEWPADPQAGDNFAWYSPEGSARLWTPYAGDLLTIANNGNVGIGTIDPQAKLDVDGGIRFRSLTSGWNGYDCLLVNADGDIVRAAPSSRRYKTHIDTLRADFRQLLGLQAFEYDYIESGERAFGFMAEDMHEAGLHQLVFYDEQGRPDAVNLRVLSIYNTELVKTVAEDVDEINAALAIAEAPDSALSIDARGRVGIGTTDPQSTLDVAGSVRARDIVVSVDRFADHVLAADYDLTPLDEVDEFIDVHGHLPGMPTEATVKREGLKLGEMDTRLLQKVEELTLYLIEMHEENQVLKTRLEALETARR